MTHKEQKGQRATEAEGTLREFRVYSVKEVAVVYYPRARAETACRSFRKLIRGDSWLYDGLCALGFKPYARTLSPAQVRFLMEHLGTPKDFVAIAAEA